MFLKVSIPSSICLLGSEISTDKSVCVVKFCFASVLHFYFVQTFYLNPLTTNISFKNEVKTNGERAKTAPLVRHNYPWVLKNNCFSLLEVWCNHFFQLLVTQRGELSEGNLCYVIYCLRKSLVLIFWASAFAKNGKVRWVF